MNETDLVTLPRAIILSEPLNIRTIAFDVPTFDRLKSFQRALESRMKRDTGNAEVLKYLVHTHPEVRALCDGD
ncbi:hypothetical protein C8J98_104233 [Luteibacter sp. OK325]|uniref:hypothetical protein n=1 Tax=Luteibacter sp. OK325 TaxID=2135670 RepID=UPI000D3B1809|nr:hypothetical protein [Luteibacter sp. OK325]PTR33022.1 hypothetical protein C8J98_104233 [Luteibacter sp. OK325]